MLKNKENTKNLIFLTLGLIVSFVVLRYFSVYAGFIFIFFVTARFLYEFFVHKPSDKTEKKPEPEELPLPYLILSGERIVFKSETFRNIFAPENYKTIIEVLPDYNKDTKIQHFSVGKKKYIISTCSMNYKEKISRVLLFTENPFSSGNNSNQTAANEQVVTGLVLVDNYEEATDNIEEAQRPILSVLIDKRLSYMMQQAGGIVKKLEKDKYIIVFYKDKLDIMKEQKFDILNQVRGIDLGNKIPVTLSIGMGISEKSLAQSMEHARQALDLALGRGGDQVLIKDDEKFYIYGGVAKEVASNERVRARVKAYALGELIDEAFEVMIMGHQNADLDCLGSAIGVHTIVRAYGKKSNIILNKVTVSIDILYDRLLKEIPEYIEDVFITGKEAVSKITANTLLIIVDTHRRTILECPEVLDKTNKIVVFDHHRKSADFIENPVLNYHEPYASSTSELITEMLLYVKHPVNLQPAEADALLAGITVDTKNFAFKTGAKTFEAAAYLKRKGADSIKVKLLFQNKMDEYKAKAATVKNAEIFCDNMAISVCPEGTEDPTLVAAQAADDLLNILGISASFVLCKDAARTVISARSLGSVNVQVIMEKLGGGGHQTVAGAQLEDTALEDGIDFLKDSIMKYKKEV